MRALKTLLLDYNALTGSIPTELVDRKGNFEFFTVEGNGFSDLIPVDGEAICSTGEGKYANKEETILHLWGASAVVGKT